MSFSLLNNGIPRLLTEEVLPELHQVFPTLSSVSYMHPFLVIEAEELPQKPWPLTLAGPALWLHKPGLLNDPPNRIGEFALAKQQFNVEGEIKRYETERGNGIGSVQARQ